MFRLSIAKNRRIVSGPENRRGAITVLAAFLMVVMLAFVALGIDIGYIAVARTELQRTADSAAMASAWEMLGQERLLGADQMNAVYSRARAKAAEYAQLNRVCGGAESRFE